MKYFNFKSVSHLCHVSLATKSQKSFLFIEMSKEDHGITPWNCGICKRACVDAESLLDNHLCAIRSYIYRDERGGSKWIVCHSCGTWYHWACVVSMSETDKELKLPFKCSPNVCNKS